MATNDGGDDYLTDDQCDGLQSGLTESYEAVTGDNDVDYEVVTMQVEDGIATVSVDCSKSAGIVSVTNEEMDPEPFRSLQNEIRNVASAAGVGDVELHERMSDFVSFRVDYS